MILFAVPLSRKRGSAAERRPFGGSGSSTSHRIIAMSCAKEGRLQSTAFSVQYERYRAIRPAYVRWVL